MPACVYERAFQNNALDYLVLTLCMFCLRNVSRAVPVALFSRASGKGKVGLSWARHTPYSLLFLALFSRASGKGKVV